MTKANEIKILNKKLKIIIKSLVVSWDNIDEIEKFKKAIKGNNIYLKTCLVDEYSKKTRTT